MSLHRIPDFGCGDNSCLVSKSIGMATNGGCRCEPRELRRGVIWWRQRATDLEKAARRLQDIRHAYWQAVDKESAAVEAREASEALDVLLAESRSGLRRRRADGAS